MKYDTIMPRLVKRYSGSTRLSVREETKNSGEKKAGKLQLQRTVYKSINKTQFHN